LYRFGIKKYCNIQSTNQIHMQSLIKTLFVEASNGFYKTKKYKVGDFFGPIDLGLHLSGKQKSLNIGVGLLAGSIFPGSNRLFFTGNSPCWGGFYVSSMGGAGLIFENLGINLLSIVGKAHTPSILYLNRIHGEEIEVELMPLNLHHVWNSGRKGIYSLTDYVLEHFLSRYTTMPRVLVTGPASAVSDFGAIASMPVKEGKATNVDTWAGRGGFGTKLLQEHGIAAIIYGGTFVDEDFRDRKVADEWFENKYNKKLAAKDVEVTTKYRFDPNFDTGGTFGVNYATIADRVMAFNYRTIYQTEAERLDIHKKFIIDHYLKQFNEETIKGKQQHTCGEPCSAVCKKLNKEFKKDYEPYQTMGPLCGIFDHRAAELLNHHADMLGFDGISVGGVLSWLMECLHEKWVEPAEFGVTDIPKFSETDFDVVNDSMYNAKIGMALLDAIMSKKIDLTEGARKFGRRLARLKGQKVLDTFLYNAFGRKGWMVPNQYWTPGALSPMAMMGKYYIIYSDEFVSPRKLGQMNAQRMIKELIVDNTGFCRFHRNWAEEMIPDIIEKLYGMKEQFMKSILLTASRINSRNNSIFWESARNADFVYTFLKRKKEKGNTDPELIKWFDYFEKDRKQAALDFWYEIHKGVHESLREFS